MVQPQPMGPNLNAPSERDKVWQKPVPFSQKAKLFLEGIMTGIGKAMKESAERKHAGKIERWLRHDRIKRLARFLMKSPENIEFFSTFLFHSDRNVRASAAAVLREAAGHNVNILRAGPAICRKLALKGEAEETKKSLLMALQSAVKNGEKLEFVDGPNGQKRSMVEAIATNLSGSKPLFGEAFLTLRIFHEAGADLSPAESYVNRVLLQEDKPSSKDPKLLVLRELIRGQRAKELAAEAALKEAGKKEKEDRAGKRAAEWEAEKKRIRELLSAGDTETVAKMLLAEVNRVKHRPVTEYVASLVSIREYALPSLEAVSVAYHHEESVNDLKLGNIIEKACSDKRPDVQRIARVHLRLPPEPEPEQRAQPTGEVAGEGAKPQATADGTGEAAKTDAAPEPQADAAGPAAEASSGAEVAPESAQTEGQNPGDAQPNGGTSQQ